MIFSLYNIFFLQKQYLRIVLHIICLIKVNTDIYKSTFDPGLQERNQFIALCRIISLDLSFSFIQYVLKHNISHGFLLLDRGRMWSQVPLFPFPTLHHISALHIHQCICYAWSADLHYQLIMLREQQISWLHTNWSMALHSQWICESMFNMHLLRQYFSKIIYLFINIKVA